MFKKLKKEKEKNKLRFFTYSVYGVIISLVFLVLCGIILNIVENKGNIKESYIFNKRPTIVITGSMEPVIKINSIVILEPVDFKDIEEGDIIRYTSYQGYSIMHRVISRQSSYVVTKGDANETKDAFVVLPNQITGRVVEIHNEFAEPLTFLFGQFKYEAVGQSILRASLGFLGIGLVLAIFVVIFILIFEMITTTYFFKKYNVELINSSSYWVKNVLNTEEQIEVLNRYLRSFKNSNIFIKIILAYKFRRYYNGLCNIEKETNKTEKRLKTLQKYFKNNGQI